MLKRQAEILGHVVQDYVSTVSPVGSGSLAEKLRLSPATIRNAMHSLGEKGYLEKPHHSSGRIPTDMGYRFFVDELLHGYRNMVKSDLAVRDAMKPLRSTLDSILREISRRLADWSNCLSFITVVEEDKSEIRKLEMTAISRRNVLIVLVLEHGLVESRIVELSVDVDDLPLERICCALNNRLSGRKVCELTPEFMKIVFEDVRGREEEISGTLRMFFLDILSRFGKRVYIERPLNLLEHPEFHDARALKPVLEVVESADGTNSLFLVPPGKDSVCITIGGEHEIDALYICSSVKCSFCIGDVPIGTVGILGPKRMKYNEICGLVEYASDILSRSLQSLSRFD